MGRWSEQVVPRVANRLLDTKVCRDARARVCAGLRGEVVELGFGSGLNVPHYPSTVTKVWAVDPSDVGFRLGRDRLAASSTPVERAALDGASLPFADASLDAALSTWTLCTIPDVDRALAEVRRVLRPGGRFHFVEHGRSPDPSVERWQLRLDPLQGRLAGGCSLSRPIDRLVRDAGFELEHLDTYYAKGDPKPFGWTYEGVAVGSGGGQAPSNS